MPGRSTTRLLALVATGLMALGLAACGGDGDAGEPTSAPEGTTAPTETPSPTPSPTPTPEPEPATAEDVDGRWCPTPESPDGSSCVTVALPNATYDDGTVVDITAHGGPTEADGGGFAFSMVDAPFGTFYPAGVPVPSGSLGTYPGPDLPEQDRVWNSQTGTMLVRPPVPEITDASCASVTGTEALAAWGWELAPAPGGTWDLADTMGWSADTYDACAELSWIVVPLENCCRADYPFEIMLFHDGEFVQTATEEVYGREPEVRRLSESEIEITRSWVPDGGAITGPFSSATSTFRWDDASGEVVRTGDLPPVAF